MFRAILLSFGLSLGLPAWGQSPALLQQITATKPVEKKAEVAKVPELTPELQKAAWQEKLKIARAKLVQISAPAVENTLPAHITLENLASYRQDLQGYVTQLEKRISTLAEVGSIEKSAIQAQQALAKWQGYKEPAPYSALLVDRLRGQLEVAREKKIAAESTLEIIQRHLEKSQQEESDATSAAKQAETARAASPNDPTLVWRAEAAAVRGQLRSEMLAGLTRLSFIETQKKTEATANFSLIEKKLQQVVYEQNFSKEDLDKILLTSSERLTALDKEISDLDKRLLQAQAARRRLGYEEIPEGKESEIARLRVEAADIKQSCLEESKPPLEQLKRIELLVQDACKKRFDLFAAKERKDREKPRANLLDSTRQFGEWRTYASSQLALFDARNRELAAQIVNLNESDPRGEYLREMQDAYADKAAYFRAIQQMSSLQIEQIESWLGDFDLQDQRRSWSQRAKDSWYIAKKMCVNFGNIGVWSYQDPLGNTKSITIWLCILALALFLVGNRLISWVTFRIMHWFVGRKKVGEAQANTLRRWLAFLAGFFLVLGTLKILAIPLTVFAFFGGALAIGLGFGTQTIIKNFISGIIMLFERQIRVGDVVELTNGRVGSVVEINTRSSVIRSGDGAETLVPNSTFLESSVVNLTHSSRTVRRALRVGVSYGSDVQKVASILQECAERHGKVLKSPEPMVIFEDFGDSALLFSVNYWLHMDDKPAPQVASDLRFMIDKKFTEAGISMPFPQRDLNINGPIPVTFAAGQVTTEVVVEKGADSLPGSEPR